MANLEWGPNWGGVSKNTVDGQNPAPADVNEYENRDKPSTSIYSPVQDSVHPRHGPLLSAAVFVICHPIGRCGSTRTKAVPLAAPTGLMLAPGVRTDAKL